MGDESTWHRTGDRSQDELALYTESYFYDCSFLVGEIDKKLFKCHKLILAKASKVFAALLFGNFEESFKGKDDPIHILDVSPNTFDLAMKFVYGKNENFADIHQAIDVYKFAHKWMMCGVMKAAEDVMEKCGPEEALPVYECFKMLSTSQLEFPLAVMEEQTKAVIGSLSWLEASKQTVIDVLQLDHLNISSELELFDAIVKWGKAQVTNNEQIRHLIDEPLKLIRFRNLEPSQFASLCEKNADVLTDGEKLKIFMSIDTGRDHHLPDGFSKLLIFRNLDSQPLRSNFGQQSIMSDVSLNSKSNSSVLKFQTPCEGFVLTGIQLQSLSAINIGKKLQISCSVSSALSPNRILAYADFDGKIKANTNDFLSFSEHVLIKKDISYSVAVIYLQEETVVSKQYKYGSQLIWNNEFIGVFPKTENTHNDIQALVFSAKAL
ncbi:kelch-like protein 40b isoform X2 [Neocloeon triangulifer]|nr:kelch-like protein 40b isoform X2 [Neocloeon triangulifer]XP_059487649.1 kelch-like protein 40b isoform X2 [Neocloeon triangulifer]